MTNHIVILCTVLTARGGPRVCLCIFLQAESGLAENMKKIEGNFKAVDERIESLNKNIAKLS